MSSSPANGLSKLFHYIFFHLVRLLNFNCSWEHSLVSYGAGGSTRFSEWFEEFVWYGLFKTHFRTVFGLLGTCLTSCRRNFLQWHTKKFQSTSKQNIFFVTTYNLSFISFYFFLFSFLFFFCFTNTLTPYRVGLLPPISFFYYLICSNNAQSIKCCYFSSDLRRKLLTWNFVRSYWKFFRCYYNGNHVLKVWYNLKNLGKNRFMCFWFTAALRG